VPELFCEEIAHRAGFTVSVGNWITPTGSLITGKNYETHHWETIKEHIGYDPEPDNHLAWMNDQISNGYIRLVFRNDVLLQVSGDKKEDIWSETSNVIMMRDILKKIPEIEIHIFSRTFYVIGLSSDIVGKKLDKLQIQEA
jgi:hypothetical protein